jgi:hypothetical protein
VARKPAATQVAVDSLFLFGRFGLPLIDHGHVQ